MDKMSQKKAPHMGKCSDRSKPWAKGGGSFDLLALLAFLPSVISSFLLKIGGQTPPPRPLPFIRHWNGTFTAANSHFDLMPLMPANQK